jgi:hypothetical protein
VHQLVHGALGCDTRVAGRTDTDVLVDERRSETPMSSSTYGVMKGSMAAQSDIDGP